MGGGVRKVPKKCHVLFEWPLNYDDSRDYTQRDLIQTMQK